MVVSEACLNSVERVPFAKFILFLLRFSILHVLPMLLLSIIFLKAFYRQFFCADVSHLKEFSSRNLPFITLITVIKSEVDNCKIKLVLHNP